MSQPQTIRGTTQHGNIAYHVVDTLAAPGTQNALPPNLAPAKKGQFHLNDQALDEILKIKNDLEKFESPTKKQRFDPEFGRYHMDPSAIYAHADSPCSSDYTGSAHATPVQEMHSPPMGSVNMGYGYDSAYYGYSSGDERRSSSDFGRVGSPIGQKTVFKVVPKSGAVFKQTDGSVVRVASDDKYVCVVEGYEESRVSETVIPAPVYQTTTQSRVTSAHQYSAYEPVAEPHRHQVYSTLESRRHTPNVALSEHSVSSNEQADGFSSNPESSTVYRTATVASVSSSTSQNRRKRPIEKIETDAIPSDDKLEKKRKERRKETNRKASQNYRRKQNNAKNNKVEEKVALVETNAKLKLELVKSEVRVEMMVKNFAEAVLSSYRWIKPAIVHGSCFMESDIISLIRNLTIVQVLKFEVYDD